MATLNVYKCDLDGGKPTFTAAAESGDDFVNSGRAVLVVKNGGVDSVTVTVDAVRLCSYGYEHDAIMTVAPSEEGWLGVFPVFWYNDDTGKAHITYSEVTGVTVAVVEV